MGTSMPPPKINKWRQRLERGQGLVEYALILVSIVIVVIAVLAFIGSVVENNMYSKIVSGFPNP